MDRSARISQKRRNVLHHPLSKDSFTATVDRLFGALMHRSILLVMTY